MYFWMHTKLHTVGGFFFLHFWGPCGTSWVGSCMLRGQGHFDLHGTIWTTPSHITITLVHIWAHLLQHKITCMMFLCNTCEVYYKLCNWCWDSELKHYLQTDSYLGESQFKSLLRGQQSLSTHYFPQCLQDESRKTPSDRQKNLSSLINNYHNFPSASFRFSLQCSWDFCSFVIGCCVLMFQINGIASSSMVDETNMLSWNVGNQLLSDITEKLKPYLYIS